MKFMHKSDRRSLWGAGALDTAGKFLQRREKMVESGGEFTTISIVAAAIG